VSTEGGSPTDRSAPPSKPQVNLRLFVSRPVRLPACGYGEPPDERSHRSHRLTNRVHTRP